MKKITWFSIIIFLLVGLFCLKTEVFCATYELFDVSSFNTTTSYRAGLENTGGAGAIQFFTPEESGYLEYVEFQGCYQNGTDCVLLGNSLNPSILSVYVNSVYIEGTWETNGGVAGLNTIWRYTFTTPQNVVIGDSISLYKSATYNAERLRLKAKTPSTTYTNDYGFDISTGDWDNYLKYNIEQNYNRFYIVNGNYESFIQNTQATLQFQCYTPESYYAVTEFDDIGLLTENDFLPCQSLVTSSVTYVEMGGYFEPVYTFTTTTGFTSYNFTTKNGAPTLVVVDKNYLSIPTATNYRLWTYIGYDDYNQKFGLVLLDPITNFPNQITQACANDDYKIRLGFSGGKRPDESSYLEKWYYPTASTTKIFISSSTVSTDTILESIVSTSSSRIYEFILKSTTGDFEISKLRISIASSDTGNCMSMAQLIEQDKQDSGITSCVLSSQIGAVWAVPFCVALNLFVPTEKGIKAVMTKTLGNFENTELYKAQDSVRQMVSSLQNSSRSTSTVVYNMTIPVGSNNISIPFFDTNKIGDFTRRFDGYIKALFAFYFIFYCWRYVGRFIYIFSKNN